MSSRLAISGKLGVMSNKAEQHRQVTSPYKRSQRVHWVIPTRSSVCARRSFAFTNMATTAHAFSTERRLWGLTQKSLSKHYSVGCISYKTNISCCVEKNRRELVVAPNVCHVPNV